MGEEYQPNNKVIMVLERLFNGEINKEEAKSELSSLVNNENIVDLMLTNPANFIPAY